MTTHHTVVVPTWGGSTLAVPEPAWCTGQHTPGEHPTDFAHEGLEHALTVETARGTVRTLLASLEQRPFRTSDKGGPAPFVAVELDGDWYHFDPAGLAAFADQLCEHADQLRALGDELAVLLAEYEETSR